MPQTHTIPWGMRLVSDRLAPAPPAYVSVELDPDTQMAVYRDSTGGIIEMGKHSTNRDRNTSTVSGGGDGEEPQRQTQDDSVTDHESD
jgi:putative ATP-grasp target RiPP